MKSLKQVIERYTGGDQEFIDPEHKTISLSARVGLEYKIKLEVLALLFGKKRTPLLAELIETSVHEVYENVQLTEELKKYFLERMEEEGFQKGDI
ncbi:MAG: hypothetical protein D3923_08190 [Candidatus Electrothrix sp. AR3]|nr:hypothetical protein [Candidatus Electrothrix sp. AR3]